MHDLAGSTKSCGLRKRFRFPVVAVVFACVSATTGCSKTGAPEDKKSNAGKLDQDRKQKSPKFRAMVIQLHPSGRYWKHELTRKQGSELEAVGVVTRFPPTGKRKFTLELRVTFAAHVDGKDEYRVSRTTPPHGKDDVNSVELPVRFDGGPIVVFDDEFGKTLFLRVKTE